MRQSIISLRFAASINDIFNPAAMKLRCSAKAMGESELFFFLGPEDELLYFPQLFPQPISDHSHSRCYQICQ